MTYFIEIVFPSVSPTRLVVDNFLHKNTATDDDGIYEGVDFHGSVDAAVATSTKKSRKSESPKNVDLSSSGNRRKSESPKNVDLSSSDNRLSDKSTQTGMDDEDEEKKRKKSGNCVIL
jgi:hypothetical protein